MEVHMPRNRTRLFVSAAAFMLALAIVSAQPKAGLTSADLYKLQSVGDVQASPDGVHVAYSVQSSDRPGRPYSRLWMMSLATGRSWRIGGDSASGPVWSPDGRLVAFSGREGEKSGLMTAAPDGSGVTFIAPIEGTNHPLPSSGDRFAWSPDGNQIAFISATPGPEADANGDPMVITRYLYKPTASEGLTRFNDNRRVHIFIADLATRKVRQLTSGDYYEHSIDWSPRGDEIVFVSNRGPDPDRFFNYDVFAVKVTNGSLRRLSDTKSAEYRPKWSPDGRLIAFQGTTRDLTSSETTMEDTHVWVMDADGGNRRELGRLDNRQGPPEWSADGRSLYFTVQERGSNRVFRQALGQGAPALVTPGDGVVGGWSPLRDGRVVYAFADRNGPAELMLTEAPKEAVTPLTKLNKDLLAERRLGRVDAFTFKSFDGTNIEAFLTLPPTIDTRTPHPMIVMIHGGPHGQQGPGFNSKAQIYASQGWAALMVNYRGSTGYGQKLADAIFGDQNGGEAKDVLAGVDAALANNAWIDRSRLGIEGGSYGGQLTNWIVTQTDRFRAAVPLASISNLVSFNYMAYYHDYLAVEFGSFPHQKGLMDLLWQRSPIGYVQNVKTPVLLLHGENDNDVPIAEAEQFYIALRDVGVESIMVRYPREGHGIRETKHVVDVIDRSIAWYRRHFASSPSTASR
jgi:dipeptidyl aminopeptidase/acylaminoacyl peptidase